MRVLIVDDNQEIRSALTLVLQEWCPSCQVFLAGHETEAIVALRTASPDVVLLDWDLEDHTAVTVISRAKAGAEPVVVVAMSSRTEARDESMVAGADIFISTGDPPERLFECLARLQAGERQDR